MTSRMQYGSHSPAVYSDDIRGICLRYPICVPVCCVLFGQSSVYSFDETNRWRVVCICQCFTIRVLCLVILYIVPYDAPSSASRKRSSMSSFVARPYAHRNKTDISRALIHLLLHVLLCCIQPLKIISIMLQAEQTPLVTCDPKRPHRNLEHKTVANCIQT